MTIFNHLKPDFSFSAYFKSKRCDSELLLFWSRLLVQDVELVRSEVEALDITLKITFALLDALIDLVDVVLVAVWLTLVVVFFLKHALWLCGRLQGEELNFLELWI